MGKTKGERYRCQSCDHTTVQWAGQCPQCKDWNTLAEETTTSLKPSTATLSFESLNVDHAPPLQRITTGYEEVDRVCGQGLVPGSVLLLGGDPGIGKSTLLLQICLTLPHKVLYVSGEEGTDQIRLRAQRLDEKPRDIRVASFQHLDPVLKKIQSLRPTFLVIDSIQTMWTETVDGVPGTVTQIRACTHLLVYAAKTLGVIIVLVGHITKEGMIAGPKVLEHMVDTVLYFEGDRNHRFRLLRSVKNRFGPTDEVGVFDMTARGLEEVKNPSALFLQNRTRNISGTCIFSGIEGTRPLLSEIQALVAPSFLSTPRRSVVGWDQGRLAMILAVLETRCHISFAKKDVYLNVTGGLKIQEPAADLPVALALISCYMEKALPAESLAFGEIGLSGDVRTVPYEEYRCKEAQKLGFSYIISPKSRKTLPQGLTGVTFSRIQQYVQWLKDEDQNGH